MRGLISTRWNGSRSRISGRVQIFEGLNLTQLGIRQLYKPNKCLEHQSKAAIKKKFINQTPTRKCSKSKKRKFYWAPPAPWEWAHKIEKRSFPSSIWIRRHISKHLKTCCKTVRMRLTDNFMIVTMSVKVSSKALQLELPRVMMQAHLCASTPSSQIRKQRSRIQGLTSPLHRTAINV